MIGVVAKPVCSYIDVSDGRYERDECPKTWSPTWGLISLFCSTNLLVGIGWRFTISSWFINALNENHKEFGGQSKVVSAANINFLNSALQMPSAKSGWRLIASLTCLLDTLISRRAFHLSSWNLTRHRWAKSSSSWHKWQIRNILMVPTLSNHESLSFLEVRQEITKSEHKENARHVASNDGIG